MNCQNSRDSLNSFTHGKSPHLITVSNLSKLGLPNVNINQILLESSRLEVKMDIGHLGPLLLYPGPKMANTTRDMVSHSSSTMMVKLTSSKPKAIVLK